MKEPQTRMSAEDFKRKFGGVAVGTVKGPAIRLHGAQRMTKVEVEYERILKTEFPAYAVRFEMITLRLPGGSRYTPDLSVWAGNQIVLLVEIKGAYRLGSAGRSHMAFNEAIAAFPNLKFRFAQKTKDGWTTKESK